jgi:hypothetical protein
VVERWLETVEPVDNHIIIMNTMIIYNYPSACMLKRLRFLLLED